MRFVENEKGIALVTSLMFTLLALVITMSLLYMVTTGIRTSGALKRYKTVTEAAYGGTDIVVKDLITASFGFSDYSAVNPGTGFRSFMKDSYMANLSNPDVSNCFRVKLTSPKSKWGACNDDSFNLTNSYDVSFNLNSASASPYTVHSKIVDTMERKFLTFDTTTKTSQTVTIAGNSDTSSAGVLEGGSTTEGSGVTVPHYPYMYRIEVQGQSTQNQSEKSNISVQYAY